MPWTLTSGSSTLNLATPSSSSKRVPARWYPIVNQRIGTELRLVLAAGRLRLQFVSEGHDCGQEDRILPEGKRADGRRGGLQQNCGAIQLLRHRFEGRLGARQGAPLSRVRILQREFRCGGHCKVLHGQSICESRHGYGLRGFTVWVEVAKSVAIELKRNGLTCAVDDSSGLILCEKKGIRVSDFPDLRLQIQTDQFTIPAAELVEIVPFLPASALVVNNRGEQGDIQAARTDFARRLHPGHAVLPIVLHHTGAYGRLQWIDRDLHACVLT